MYNLSRFVIYFTSYKSSLYDSVCINGSFNRLNDGSRMINNLYIYGSLAYFYCRCHVYKFLSNKISIVRLSIIGDIIFSVKRAKYRITYAHIFDGYSLPIKATLSNFVIHSLECLLTSIILHRSFSDAKGKKKHILRYYN